MLEKLKEDAEDAFLARWINDELTPAELDEFKKHPEFKEYQKIRMATEALSLRDFDEDTMLSNIKKSKTTSTAPVLEKKVVKLWPYLSIAASIAILITIFVFNNNDVSHITDFGEKRTVSLPDGSEMILNAKSKAQYEKKWEEHRIVSLQGEAFFKVTKGNKFVVQTSNGNVAVLGTQFDVNVQGDLFEVTCYEGKVEVISGTTKEILTKGETFRAINGKPEEWIGGNIEEEPAWITNRSTFYSVPVSYVFQELEEQYNLTIKNNPLDNNIIFTGTFPNNNLEIALKTVFKSLNLSYEVSKDKRTVIVIK